MTDKLIGPYGSGSGSGSGYGSGSGSGYGSGDGYGDGSGYGDGDGRKKIELNILKNIPDRDLPLYLNIWEFQETKTEFHKRLLK